MGSGMQCFPNVTAKKIQVIVLKATHIFNPQKIWKNSSFQEITTYNNGQKSAFPSYDVTLMKCYAFLFITTHVTIF